MAPARWTYPYMALTFACGLNRQHRRCLYDDRGSQHASVDRGHHYLRAASDHDLYGSVALNERATFGADSAA